MNTGVLFVFAVCAFLAVGSAQSANDVNNECNLGGQMFWCASVENARRCNMEAFCRSRCWAFFDDVEGFHRQYRLTLNASPRQELIHLCTSAIQQNKIRNALCDECKVVIQDLDYILVNKSYLDSVVSALRFACNFIPGYSTMCRNIVQDIGSMIGGLEPYLREPEKVCQAIKVCPNEAVNETSPLTSLFQKFYLAQYQRASGSNSWCDDCQKACGDIKQQLEDPSQQENIKETFLDFCSFLGPLKNPCNKYVEQFVPQLIQWMISLFNDPQGLCTRLGFCKQQ